MLYSQQKIAADPSIIQKHIDKREFVKIIRTFQGNDYNLFGVILDMSEEFLLMQLSAELAFDGYAILRISEIEALRCNKTDRFQKKMLTMEGIFNVDSSIQGTIDLISWASIFKDLRKNHLYVMAELEDLGEPDFFIGPIKRVAKNYMSIQWFDPTGVLFKYWNTVHYDSITTVRFDNHYINTYKKYLKPPKNK